MTTLVTGAGGFLGSHVIDLLVARGERPRALLRPGEPVPRFPGPVDVYTADIRRSATLRRALTGVQLVLHCAAKTGPWGDYREYLSTNVDAVEGLVREATRAGVSRIVHVSSVTVHGNDVGGDADEDTPLREERNPYSRTKVAAERLLRQMIDSESAPVTIVRPGWIYGPRDRASFARLVNRIETGRMVLAGGGSNHLPLVYVRDVARGVLLAGEAAAAEGRAYLLVNDEPVTQCQYVKAIAAELGVAAPTRRVGYQSALAAAGIVEALVRLSGRRGPPPVMRFGIALLGGENRFSIDRARRELGFSPRVSMADGVARSVKWYRSEPIEPAALEAA